MKSLKAYLFAALLAVAPIASAYGQSFPGLFPTGTVYGNPTASTAPPIATAAPVFGTSARTPLLIGGTGAASTLTIESTSGAGTTDSIIFKTGSQSTRWTMAAAGTLVGGAGVGISQSGSSSGTISFLPQAAAGTYNWNWPITAGSSGAPLLSAGGGASPMTFGIVTGTFGGTGVNNGASTITIGGNVIHAGAFQTTLTVSATTNSTLPAGTQTLAATTLASQVISGGSTVTALTQATGNITVDCGLRPLQFITNGGAFTITAPAADSSCILLVTNNGSAGTITFSGFSVGGNTGDNLTTTNTSKFMVWVARINGSSTYRIASLQ